MTNYTTTTTTTDQDMEKIVNKVQKLFALAGNNPSEQEATAALLKAQALLAKYNLSQADVEGENAKEWKHELLISKVSKGAYTNWLGAVIIKSFGCKNILLWQGSQQKIAIMGRSADAHAALNALNFAYKVLRKKGNQAVREAGYSIGERGSTMIFNTYASGFVSGIQSVLEEQTKALAIVVPSDTEEAFNEKFPDVRNVRSRSTKVVKDSNLRARGYADGRSCMGERALNS